MNNCAKLGTLLAILIFAQIANAQLCSPPKSGTCAYYSPDNTTHVGIKVNFTKTRPDQIVYLDGGCEIGTYEFKPHNLINTLNRYPRAKVTLQLTYCIGNHFINKETINVTSDSAIICNISDKMTCNKTAD